MENNWLSFFIILICNINSPAFAANLFQTHQIPSFQRSNKEDPIVMKILSQARAIKRAENVSIGFSQIEDPQLYSESLRTDIQKNLPIFKDHEIRVFSGSTTSELQFFLQEINKPQQVILQAFEIKVDQTIQMPANTFIQGKNTRFIAEFDFKNPVFNFLNIQQSGLSNIEIEAEQSIHLNNAQHIVLKNLEFKGGRGIAIFNGSRYVELANLQMKQARFGALMLQGDVSHIWVHHSQFIESQRADNGGAAILLTDAQNKSNIEEHSAHNVLTETIFPIAPAPHAILIEQNELSNNRAQGLYLDGVFGVVVQHNLIENNDKEGMCLDFGSVNNIVMENTILRNGNRARQTDQDLELDLVLGFGKMADGSAISKLPGIALDNAAQNIILSNVINHNAGDGIKIVRSGFRNLMLFNSITDNNRGSNSHFQFFGILLGSAGLEQELSHEDINKHPLDFLPPLENIIAGNVIYGTHRAGVLLDKDAIFNDIYDNQVRHFRVVALESASPYFNSIIGNSWQPVQISPTQTLLQSYLVRLWSIKGLILISIFIGFGVILFISWRKIKKVKS